MSRTETESDNEQHMLQYATVNQRRKRQAMIDSQMFRFICDQAGPDDDIKKERVFRCLLLNKCFPRIRRELGLSAGAKGQVEWLTKHGGLPRSIGRG